MHDLDSSVQALMRDVADTIIMPRFRNLAIDEVAEKSPGDLVTIADRESEARLAAGLAALRPGARVVGEEAAASDPAQLDDLGRGTIWVIDPLDGTMNFAEGIRPFAVMVALLQDGICEAGWILDPATGRMCHASRGGGAWIDGARVGPPARRPRPVAAIALHFLSPESRAAIERRAAGKVSLVAIPRCAGEQYARLILGENDIALFERSWPWDHLAGALMVEEVGGRVARRDGAPYRADAPATGLFAANSRAAWDHAAAAFG
jgi:fructose-1,6-bisphosphatase/inositol monophosphatase family enzyme